MYTNIGDLTDKDAQSEIDVQCTIITKQNIKSFGHNNTGRKLAGILADSTGEITYIGWHDNAKTIDEEFVIGSSYILQKVKVGKCAAQFALTPDNIQLIITESSIISKDNESTYICPLSLRPIKDVRQFLAQRINVAGVITAKEREKRGNTEHLSVKIQDESADIDVSFYSDAATKFTGEIGDIMLLRNVSVKEYGLYLVLKGDQNNYTINLNHLDLVPLQQLNTTNEASHHMSPKKIAPAKLSSMSELRNDNRKQQFEATPVGLLLNT